MVDVDLHKIYFFSTFFFNQLTLKEKNNPDFGYEKVKSWTNKVDLFEKNYIVIPVNEQYIVFNTSLHWYLAIIHNPGALLDDFDSNINNDLNDALDDQDTDDKNQTENTKKIDNDSDAVEEIVDVSDGDEDFKTCPEHTKSVVDQELANDKIVDVDKIPESQNNLDENNEGEYCSNQNAHNLLSQVNSFLKNATYSKLSENIEIIPDSQPQNDIFDLKNIDNNDIEMATDRISIKKPQKSKPKKTRQNSIDLKLKTKFTKINDLPNQYQKFNIRCRIIIIDSLGVRRQKTLNVLKSYICKEILHRKQKTRSESSIKGYFPKFPIQPNSFDCGVYVLQNVETIFGNPDKILLDIVNSANLCELFTQPDINQKRIFIRNLITKFTNDQVRSEKSITNEEREVVHMDDDDDIEIVEIS
jgi:hypothetical protein